MNIVVTGAGKGIGFQLVKIFAERANNKILAISREITQLEKLKENQNFANIIPLALDITSSNLKEELEPVIESVFSHIDILINNAGLLVNKPFQEIKTEEIEKVYKVNVFAPYKLIQILTPLLKKSDKAHIVNISSMGGVQGTAKFAGLSAYSSSKGAMSILSECLAEEFKETNISVNCLALGAVQTEMLEAAFPGYKAPLSSNEMARYISDFAYSGMNYFNGKIIPVSLSTP